MVRQLLNYYYAERKTNSMDKKRRVKTLGSLLFIIYLLFLVWIILFKLQFSLNDIDPIRFVNLVPFHYTNAVSELFQIKEIRDNVLIFIPFGILLSMLAPKMNLRSKILIIFGTSFAFETMQYILSIGVTDITDLITNVSGGIIGIFSYTFLLKLVKDKQRIDAAISIFGSILAVLFSGLMSILLLANQ